MADKSKKDCNKPKKSNRKGKKKFILIYWIGY